MLRGGAWCASVGAFLVIVSVCAWMAYRIGRISLARARLTSWIDLKEPQEEYYDDTTTTQLMVTKSEVTPEAIAEHFVSTPRFKYVRPKMTPGRIYEAPGHISATAHKPSKSFIPFSSKFSG